jgi:hypothetical protein
MNLDLFIHISLAFSVLFNMLALGNLHKWLKALTELVFVLRKLITDEGKEDDPTLSK